MAAVLPYQFTMKNGESLRVDIATLQDLEECCEFSREFFFRAPPLSLILKTEVLEALDFVIPWIRNCIKSNVSLVVRNEAGQVVAVRMSEVSTRDNPAQVPESAMQHFDFILETLSKGFDLFDQYKTDKLFHFVLMAVHPRYGNQGLGHKLLEISVDIARNTGSGLITMEAVNKYALRAGIKNGFQILNSIDFHTFKERIPNASFTELLTENPKAYMLVRPLL